MNRMQIETIVILVQKMSQDAAPKRRFSRTVIELELIEPKQRLCSADHAIEPDFS
jgi:hypothetical protein